MKEFFAWVGVSLAAFFVAVGGLAMVICLAVFWWVIRLIPLAIVVLLIYWFSQWMGWI